MRRGYLGVQYQEVTYALAKAFELDNVEGALLNQITKDSVADKAGLKNGDIVVKFDGKPIRRAGELPFIVGLISPGTNVKVDIVREGQRKRLNLTVGERPSAEQEVAQVEDEPETSSLGLMVEDITDELRELIEGDGIRVSRVLGGPAARAGIRRQDIILSVANINIRSVSQFNEIVAKLPKGEGIPVLVLRPPGIQRFMSIYIPE